MRNLRSMTIVLLLACNGLFLKIWWSCVNEPIDPTGPVEAAAIEVQSAPEEYRHTPAVGEHIRQLSSVGIAGQPTQIKEPVATDTRLADALETGTADSAMH